MEAENAIIGGVEDEIVSVISIPSLLKPRCQFDPQRNMKFDWIMDSNIFL